jgi:hypothetical protein
MTEQTTTENQTPAETDPTPAAAPASKRQMSFSVLDTGVIRADFDGSLEPLFLDPAKVPESLQAAAMTEGLISRSRGYTSKLTDKERTPQALRTAIEKGFAALLAGVWKLERAAAGESEYSSEVEAAHRFRIARAKAKGEEYAGTLAESAANFAALTDEQKKTLKALPRYQAMMAEVKAERAAAKAAKLAKAADAAEDESPF